MGKWFNRLIALFFVAVSLPFLLIGLVFTFHIWRADSDQVFRSPSGAFRITLSEDCLSGSCRVFASLFHETHGDMICRLSDAEGEVSDSEWDLSRVAATWAAEEGSVSLDNVAGSSNLVLRLKQDCFRETRTTIRQHHISFIFRENCIGPTCWRGVELVRTRAGYNEITPCDVRLEGTGYIFTSADPHAANVEVSWSHEDRSARWKSLSSGVTGLIKTEEACDFSKSRKAPVPP